MSVFGLAMVAAAVAGFSRGFAAFGTAMVYVPLMALAYDAKTAVVTLFLVDILPALPLVWRAAPQCDKPTMGWMTLGALAASPLGVAVLLVADPVQARLILGIILLVAVSIMALKPKLRIATTPANGVCAGAVSGFAGGICGIFGPPAMVYLLGRGADAQRTRADTIVFLTGESLVLGISYLGYGLYTVKVLELAAMLLPIYASTTWIGARCFSHTGEAAYRKLLLAALWVISAALLIQAGIALF
jgi:uncharacterized membrane protein YfcA